jgi:DNA-binding response OmpR family regulator
MINIRGERMKNDFKILVVDDEKNILDVVKAYLEKEDLEVITAMDGEAALGILSRETIHLVVLDLMLPKLSGEEVCHRIRATSDIPIIMLTAKADEDDRIEGISIGADDYLSKPFSARELVVRVRALLRRAYREHSPLADILSFNNSDLEVDIQKMLIKKQGQLVNLTTNEFKVLATLLINPGQVFSREHLVEKAFGMDYEGFDRTVDTYIKNIRQKIEDNPKEPTYIHTIYGAGYKFLSQTAEVKQ